MVRDCGLQEQDAVNDAGFSAVTGQLMTKMGTYCRFAGPWLVNACTLLSVAHACNGDPPAWPTHQESREHQGQSERKRARPCMNSIAASHGSPDRAPLQGMEPSQRHGPAGDR